MEHQLISWTVVGGPRTELASTLRDRQNLQAFLDARRATHVPLIERLRGIGRRSPEAEIDLVCCTA